VVGLIQVREDGFDPSEEFLAVVQSFTARVVRVNSATPKSRSSPEIVREASGWDMPNCCPAREKLPAWAVRTKSRKASIRSLILGFHEV
jgi:hypothetical protein